MTQLERLDQFVLENSKKVTEELCRDGFKVLNICHVWDWMEVNLGIKLIDLTWEQECEHIKRFCENFQLYLYEVPGDKFFEWEGIEMGQKNGYKGVILSSLS